MPPPYLQPRQSEGGGLSLGWLLAIVIAGGSLVFVSIAFILVTITDRRSHRAQLEAEVQNLQGRHHELDSSSLADHNGSPVRRTRRRLMKSPRVVPMKRRASSIPLLLPHLASSGSLSHLFSTPRKNKDHAAQGSRRRNSWVDEDAIHGPKIGRPTTRESKRISFRDSWLIMRAPTLPALLGYRDDSDSDSFYQHQNYPLVPQPRPVAIPPERQQALQVLPAANEADQEKSPPTSRLPLVRSPSYELAEKRAAALRATLSQMDPSPGLPQGPRPPPAARLRHANTETDLQMILKNTAQRLRGTSFSMAPAQAQTPTRKSKNMPTRHQRTPSMRESPVKMRRVGGMLPYVPYRGVDATPSPQKRPQAIQTPQSAPANINTESGSPKATSAPPPPVQTPTRHRRNVSQSSVMSEGDSLFGETTPEQPESAMASGLTSPSRRVSDNNPPVPIVPPQFQPMHQRKRSMSVPSMTSSVSSALSTVYSEEEEPEEETAEGHSNANALQPPNSSQSVQRAWSPRMPLHSPKMSDPFLVPRPSRSPAPKVPERSPRRSLMTMMDQQPSHSGLQAQQPRRSSHDLKPLGSISGNAQTSGSSPIMSSLSLSHGLDAAKREELRLSIMMSPPQMTGRGDMRPKTVSMMKPTYFATSSSVVSMAASPSTPEEERKPRGKGHRARASSGGRSAVVPPPLNLRPIEGSPRIEEADEAKFPDLKDDDDLQLPPSAFERVRSSIMASESMDRVPSLPSSPLANRPLPSPPLTDDLAALPIGDSPSRGPSNASNSSSHYYSQAAFHTGSPNRTPSQIRTTPKRSTPSHISPLQASIVQLRRMNSQMSTHSHASSAAESATCPGSPTLPALRGGGFSPDRSNSRTSKSARQNYLNLGTPSPGSSPGNRSRRSRCIRNARDSIQESQARHPSQSETGVEENSANGPQATPTRSTGLKGSFRNSESPKRRLSVRFGDVKEHIFVQDRKIAGGSRDSSAETDTETEMGAQADVVSESEKERQRESEEESSARQDHPAGPRPMRDSLGLYDKDGFLMSSPDRLPSSAVKSVRSSGLRI